MEVHMKMKTAKLTVMFLACAAAIPAFAQNTTDSRCGITNYDGRRNMFTIINPSPETTNQQCFITVVPKQSWPGGLPNLTSSQIIEGNYEVTLSGGGGGGGGGVEGAGGGGGGAGAVPNTSVRYLQPGVYRLTFGAGGQGGPANGGNGGDGAPTSLAEAYSGQTVAGFAGAESWNGTYPQSYNVASAGRNIGQSDAQPDGSGGRAVGGQAPGGRGGRVGREPNGMDGGRLTTVAMAGEPGKGGTDLAGHRLRHEVAGGGGGGAGFGNGGNGDSAAEDGKMKTGARAGDLGAGGGGGAGGEGVADRGAPGGNGFIRLALKDQVAQAPAQPEPAMSSSSTSAVTPVPVYTRPARRDRN
jgi:hypothetical protein